MRLWGGQLGLIPVTCCGTNITGEGIDAWSNWQVHVFDSAYVGKTGECARADCKGCFFVASSYCCFYGHICEEGGSLFQGWSNIYTGSEKLQVISSVKLHIIRKEAGRQSAAFSRKHLNLRDWTRWFLRVPPSLACASWVWPCVSSHNPIFLFVQPLGPVVLLRSKQTWTRGLGDETVHIVCFLPKLGDLNNAAHTNRQENPADTETRWKRGECK